MPPAALAPCGSSPSWSGRPQGGAEGGMSGMRGQLKGIFRGRGGGDTGAAQKRALLPTPALPSAPLGPRLPSAWCPLPSLLAPPAGGLSPRPRRPFESSDFRPGSCVLSCRILDLVQSGLCSSGWGWGGGEATQTWVFRARCCLPTSFSPSPQNWPAMGPGGGSGGCGI